eukprot:scaffold86629_cov66-Phaeocystis_antarctica.AAC.1
MPTLAGLAQPRLNPLYSKRPRLNLTKPCEAGLGPGSYCRYWSGAVGRWSLSATKPDSTGRAPPEALRRLCYLLVTGRDGAYWADLTQAACPSA